MILYPIACDVNGAALHIDDWERGQAVTCFGCGETLIGRLPYDGIKPTAHFSHRADAACNGETALHKAAKAAITRSHANGVLRALSWECPHCKRCCHQTDLSVLALHEEMSPCVGVVSDVLGVDGAGVPVVAIEVVVTHDIEVETLERYRVGKLLMFSLHPSWGSVGDIVRGVDPLPVDLRVGVADTSSCEGCQQVSQEKAEWEARARRQKAIAWWQAWISAWSYIGNDRRILSKAEQQALLNFRAREAAWWKAWSLLWPRIAEKVVDTWWLAWRHIWRELCVIHAKPYQWQRSWRSAWEAIGKQHAIDEAARARRRHDEAERDRTRGRTWWDAWGKLWPEISLRESGTMSAWRPICRRCRRDLARDHVCPCVADST